MLKTKKQGHVRVYLIATLTVALFIWCFHKPIIEISEKAKVYNSWALLADDLTVTIEEKDAYTANIRLEKENSTLKLEDLDSLLDNLKDIANAHVSTNTSNGQSTTVFEFSVKEPSKTYTAYITSTDTHTIDIKFNISYQDDFDALGYEKLTTSDIEDIEKLFGSEILTNRYVIAKLLSDGTIKVRIRTTTK